MKKRQNDSARASALQVTISVALLSISAILFASNFRAAAPAATDTAASAPVSQNANQPLQDGFYPSLPAPVPQQQGGFYPPLPLPAVPEGVPGITVALPIDTTDVAIGANFIEPVTTTLIDSTTTGGNNYVGFQGDFVFDSAVINFATSGVNGPPVRRAGLTSDSNWNVSAGILPGPGPTPGTLRIVRISAFVSNFVPLAGSGTLFELRPFRTGNTGNSTPLTWRPAAPDNFIYIDDNLLSWTPTQTNGLITLAEGVSPTPSPTATPTPTATGTPPPPILDNYPNTSIPLSTDTTVTPDAAPTNTTSINVSTSTNFKGKLEGDPATGVVRVTDAHPAGNIHGHGQSLQR